jgi:two-component system, NtrC family, response regulator HydG
MQKILVIDDDMDICHLLKRFLSKNNYEVATAHNGEAGLKLLDELQPHLVLTDFRLGDMDGSAIIQAIKAKMPQVPILVITGYSDIRTAVNVLKLGALDYITKPLLPQEILMTIQRAISFSETQTPTVAAAEVSTTPPSVVEAKTPKIGSKKSKNTTDSGYIIGESLASQNLIHQIELVAPTNFSIIIYGESGAGKEAIARMIHERSQREQAPFVAVDCGAIPKDLANSELFGHEKGAFTGAVNSKEGYFEMANGGTIFLDEVANLPYDVQVALLRVVQERKCRRVGGSKEINLNVRIIVASNERLSEAARKGKFREDLYHRFNEFSIDAPPLRDRKDDIMLFADKFLKETSADLNKDMIGFDDDVVEIFKAYSWFGNVREMKNVIKRAALLSTGNKIQAKALPFEIINFRQLSFDSGDSEPQATYAPPQPTYYQQPTPPQPIFVPPTPPSVNSTHAPINLKETANKVEYDTIIKVLQEVRFNKSKAADVLGIDRKTLYNKLKKFGIE